MKKVLKIAVGFFSVVGLILVVTVAATCISYRLEKRATEEE